MRPLRVLLSGAGGAGTIEIIKQLKSKGSFWVAAMDMDKYAAGLYMAHRGFVVPAVRSSSYWRHVKQIIQHSKIDAYIPLIDEELLGAQNLEAEIDGLKVITPTKDFIKLVLNKYQMVKAFSRAGISCPETVLSEHIHERSFRKSKIVKPITGRGSRGVALITSYRQWQEYFRHNPYQKKDVMVQDYIEGQEYTVSAVVGRTGHVYAVVPKKIISKKGITHQSVTVHHPFIEQLVLKIQDQFQAQGPFNVQLMQKGKKLYVLEVNPRFSTTVAHTMAAGVDEAGCLINDFCFGVSKQKHYHFKENLVMLRYMTQHYVPLDKIK